MTQRTHLALAAAAAAIVLSPSALGPIASAAALEDPPSIFAGFDKMNAWRADSTLADPAFAGRKSGTPGGGASEDWIAAQFAEFGLAPGGEGGSYFQALPVIGFQERSASIEILDSPFGKVRLVHGDDFALLLTPAKGKVKASAVFVGYGIDAPEKGRCDYVGVDLTGRIAVILRGHPDDGQDWDKEYSRSHTFPAAVARGAVAVLYFQGDRVVPGAALAPDAYRPDIPAAYISERVVEILLRETEHTLEQVQDALKKGPFPLETGKRVRIHFKVRGEAQSTARNVLGLLRGSDPLLSGETVVFGAHHDHIGTDAGGRLYAGANDNASGTAVLLELARTLAGAEWRPKRSILFVTFAAEEMGLLGAKQLAVRAESDTIRIVAMLNMDMVGHGDGGVGLSGGFRLGEPYLAWRNGLDSTRAALLSERRLEGSHGDYAPFLERGIPCASAWSRGPHLRYHDFEDRPRYVMPHILQAVGETVGSLLVAVADHPIPLADGYGPERAILTQAMQVSFDPIESRRTLDPERDKFTGRGRLSGRLVAVDDGRPRPEEILRRLGKLRAITEERGWIEHGSSLKGLEEAWRGLRAAALPVAGVATLEEMGEHGTRSLCAAGLAGALWPAGRPTPSEAVCDALGAERRFLVADPATDWRWILRRENALRVLVVSRSDEAIPAPPQEGIADRALLVLVVEGIADSTRIRQGMQSWGEKRLHLDISDGLGVDVPETESLRFVRWLRAEGWPDDRIREALGRNLGRFHSG